MSKRKRQKKSWLVEKHGNTIVLNKKWCLRGLGFLVMAFGTVALIFFSGPAPTIRGLAGTISTGLGCLILAEFTND